MNSFPITKFTEHPLHKLHALDAEIDIYIIEKYIICIPFLSILAMWVLWNVSMGKCSGFYKVIKCHSFAI